MDKEVNKVLLVGTTNHLRSENTSQEYLDELEKLAFTLGYKTVGRVIVKLRDVSPSTFIGKGKAWEIKELALRTGADEVIFDDDLSPRQLKNLEEIIGKEITDRTGMILEIFANHARTKEAKTQIELASLEYLLPRLRRRWTHLERQIGGIGVRGGAGETQLEVDRRLVRERIAKLRRELAEIEKERAVQRKRRDSMFRISLVGYTNTGKSTIMNLLTPANVKAEDKLFATLDTTTRIWNIDRHHKVLLSDTIGFIRKLPHNLIASFRSTLREVEEADLIIKVADISSSQCLEQLESVDEVLKQIGANHKPSIIVFNKIDTMNEEIFKKARQLYPQAIFISALQKLKVDSIRQAVLETIKKEEIELSLNLPLVKTKEISLLKNNAQILNETYLDGIANIKFRCYKKVWKWLEAKIYKSLSTEKANTQG